MSDDPVTKIEEMLRKRNWERRHLYPAMGSSARTSEIMNRIRPLTLSMIRCLVINYGMKAEDLIPWYPTRMQPKERGITLMKAFREVESQSG